MITADLNSNIPLVSLSASGIVAFTLEESLVYGLTGAISDAGYSISGIFPINVPLSVGLPALAYRLLSAEPVLAHDGKTNWKSSRLEFAAVADRYGDAKQIAEAIRSYLSGKIGALEPPTPPAEDPGYDPVFSQGIRLTSTYDDLVRISPPAFSIIQEYFIPHRIVQG